MCTNLPKIQFASLKQILQSVKIYLLNFWVGKNRKDVCWLKHSKYDTSERTCLCKRTVDEW